MTRHELKDALRPHVSRNAVMMMSPEYRKEYVLPIAAVWFGTNRGQMEAEELFKTWNNVMVELLNEQGRIH